ncbi:MAG: hypothetical protein V8K32_07255 [Candidatus Electrothrix gigas]
MTFYRDFLFFYSSWSAYPFKPLPERIKRKTHHGPNGLAADFSSRLFSHLLSLKSG